MQVALGQANPDWKKFAWISTGAFCPIMRSCRALFMEDKAAGGFGGGEDAGEVDDEKQDRA